MEGVQTGLSVKESRQEQDAAPDTGPRTSQILTPADTGPQLFSTVCFQVAHTQVLAPCQCSSGTLLSKRLL